MSKIALTLPWTNSSNTAINTTANPAQNFPADSSFTLANILNSFADVAIYVGAFLMFCWMAWVVFDYIRAEGNKEGLVKARKRIQWAIVGFVILLLSFFLSEFLSGFLFSDPNIRTLPIQGLSPLKF